MFVLPDRMTAPRVAPLEASCWSAAQRPFLEEMRADGRFLNIYATLARGWNALSAIRGTIAHIFGTSRLTARQREILVLRVGRRARCRYEWEQHVLLALEAGLTLDEIDAVARFPEAGQWAGFERALITGVDELWDDSCLSDATWAALREVLDEEAVIDLIVTVGQYVMVAMLLNSLGVQVDQKVSERLAELGANA